MPLPVRIFADDEELGKRDDDHKSGNGAIIPALWPSRHAPLRVRRRRLAIAFVGLIFLYFFVKNIPTDLGPANKRGDIRVPTAGIRPGRPSTVYQGRPMDRPPHPPGLTPADKRYYNGPIHLDQLGISLHGIAKTTGHRENNKNVLFAASSLKSASEIIPIACEMARWKRTFVHFTVMGREDLPIDALKEINGVTADCNIYWHDARPDYSVWSTDFRMEVSVGASLGHIHSFMHPQVIITDDPSKEDLFFVKAVRAKANEIGRTIIELPSDAAENLKWITRLDSGSLRAWHNVYVDILIHAPLDSSGSLIRLLRSIEQADYFGSRRPHLTIELPPETDPPTQQFLEHLVWPPIDPSGAPRTSQVTLRHRIPRQSLSTEEAASHFIESFYPARPADSHVLVLSPQVELSPLYYHYIKYNLLEYRYSSYGQGGSTNDLMGLSLELPSTHLNDSAPFDPPPSDIPIVTVTASKSTQTTPFLWQAPNSNAALYFGDKWIELHSFLSNRIAAQKSDSPPNQRPKQISKKYPSWMEYILELMRARAYTLLYPNIPSSDSIVTVHNELYQLPEEYMVQVQRPPPANGAQPSSDQQEPFTADPATHTSPSTHRERPLLSSSLMSILPSAGELPKLDSLPLLSHTGQLITPADAYTLSTSFATDFKREVGGCNEKRSLKPLLKIWRADDLFCFGNEEVVGDLEKKGEQKVDPEVEILKQGEGRGRNTGTEIKRVYGAPVVTKVDQAEEAVAAEFAAHLVRQRGKREN